MENERLLEECLGYTFGRPELLLEALTHRSWCNEGGRAGEPDNERLEFFGDALVDFLVAEFLLSRFPAAREGALTRIRAELVSESGLRQVAESIELGRFLRLGHGEELTDGRRKPALLANALEALMGAIYLDGGISPVREVLAKVLFPLADTLSRERLQGQDRKSALQELVQARWGLTPVYRLLGESGPPHGRHFVMGVFVRDELMGEGEGATKKGAQQAAAAVALERLANGERTGG